MDTSVHTVHSERAGDRTTESLRPGNIHVRLAANEADLAAMLELGQGLHAESRFHYATLDPARLLGVGRQALTTGNPGLLIAERDGRAIGMAVAVLGEHFFSPVLTATAMLLYVAPPSRGGPAAVKLLRALRRWAAKNGAADLHVNVTTAIDAARTDRMLRKMGFRQTGGNYVLEGIGNP